jgi:CTP synthase
MPGEQYPIPGIVSRHAAGTCRICKKCNWFEDAHSAELNPSTTHPIIHLMPEQDGIEDIGGTLRLGSYPCVLDESSKAYRLYGEKVIHERHRHRYEVNNYYRNES